MFALQRFKSYGTKTLTVGSNFVLTDFGLQKNAMVTGIELQVDAVIDNADAGTDYDVEMKEILSKLGIVLTMGAPVSATTIQGDARISRFLSALSNGDVVNNADPITVVKSLTADVSVLLGLPFTFQTFKRGKDWGVPAKALESLTLSLAGHPNSQDADLTWTSFEVEVIVTYYLAETIVWGPVYRARQISVSEDARSYSGKLLALASLPPLGKDQKDYPACVVSVDGDPLYNDVMSGIFPQLIWKQAMASSNPVFVQSGTGEDIFVPHWFLNGGSVLDAVHRSAELAYATSLATALGTSDTAVIVDLVNYAKPDGQVRTSDAGKGLRGAVENLPVASE